MVTIRTASVDDAAHLARLNIEVQDLHVAAEPELYATPGAGEVEAWFRAQLEAAEVRILLAESAVGAAVGYAVMRVVDWPGHVFARPRRIALVDQISVSAQHRRLGVGRALMEAAERLALEEECTAIDLEVRAFNGEAIRFYEALGFRQTTHRLSRSLR
jgi:ribosomal protein S18 acetylase RimI-like enzyme